MVQWWEHSPPTDVARDRFPDWTQYVGWVYFWFPSLFREVFLRVLQFSPLLKNQHFQIPVRSRFQWTNSHFVEVSLKIPILFLRWDQCFHIGWERFNTINWHTLPCPFLLSMGLFYQYQWKTSFALCACHRLINHNYPTHCRHHRM